MVPQNGQSLVNLTGTWQNGQSLVKLTGTWQNDQSLVNLTGTWQNERTKLNILNCNGGKKCSFSIDAFSLVDNYTTWVLEKKLICCMKRSPNMAVMGYHVLDSKCMLEVFVPHLCYFNARTSLSNNIANSL